MLKIELSFDTKQIQLTDEIISKVCVETINEIKKMIQKGKNNENSTFERKKNNEIPDFNDTGRLINAISFKVKDGEFEIFIDDENRKQVAYYLSQRNPTWNILSGGDYIEKYITQKIQQEIDKIIDSI